VENYLKNGEINGIDMPRKKTTEEFIVDAYCKHDDRYNYKFVDYKNNLTKVKIICPVHGIFEQIPGDHLKGSGCSKCSGTKRLTTEEFIKKAKVVHGDKYDYSLVEYKNRRIEIKIICPEHDIFEQIPTNHLNGKGCPKCGGNIKKTTEEFIKKAKVVHGDKYDYSLVEYKNAKTKIKIICPEHGIFEQTPECHSNSQGCPKCSGRYEKPYNKLNIPLYDTYQSQLEPYGVKCRRYKEDNNILEVKCIYCDRWFIPSRISVQNKISAINGKASGEHNLYCSIKCKKACPTYKQKIYPKDFKINTSREVQPELRKLVLKRDNYTCQKCDATNVELHCHHYEGIEVNPVESADIDQCITLCKQCHNNIHKKDKCGIKNYKRGKCK
jgi:hypothetical protein